MPMPGAQAGTSRERSGLLVRRASERVNGYLSGPSAVQRHGDRHEPARGVAEVPPHQQAP